MIWPIAERYNSFPTQWMDKRWGAPMFSAIAYGDTAAEAVARAVIGAQK